jgi:hypothetical protein
MARKKNTLAPLVMVENALPALRRAVRAVAIAGGKDETRKSFLCVEVQWNTPIGVMVTATDGYRLHTATVHVAPGCGFDLLAAPPVCRYSPKGLLLAVASGEGALHVDATGTLTVTVEGVTTSAPNVRSEALPVWNQCIPTYYGDQTLVVGLNPRYLAEAAEAAAIVSGKDVGCKFSKGDQHDPITVTVTREGHQFLAVLMPMRMESGDQNQRPVTLDSIRNAYGRTAEPVAAE